ncbi:GCN5 family N-acetyltransferase [Gordonia spumicola]|uniref:GCN5 family N-acetyltransferase n=1 Tax=Gordonia spumicola TaxID=589161 RepID=A0A7I9VEN9_9ACTN|nr:GNAT family N-acetyltransferase [Gordonia spumicola]GEE03784.1 GCN5 family N-acetyltransferase [Gordonia spumicola]
MILREPGVDDYPAIVGVWRSAVTATHDFLATEHFAEIERALPGDYLPNVTLTVAEHQGRIVGFSGVAENRLEMLFVHDDVRGTGVGTRLLDDAIERLEVTELDVNEQNPHAVEFYRRRGFEQVARSDLDGDGLPYPILTLALRR